jgi:hypothetical protein
MHYPLVHLYDRSSRFFFPNMFQPVFNLLAKIRLERTQEIHIQRLYFVSNETEDTYKIQTVAQDLWPTSTGDRTSSIRHYSLISCVNFIYFLILWL